jgi:hypothetical protein
MPVIPAPPDRIRPGQLGVLMLGRVIIGDIAATLVDLSVRGLLDIEERAGSQGGWLLRPQAAGPKRDSLLAYEKTLLEAVPGGEPSTLQSLAPGIPHVLSTARDAIVHDAISRGWLHRIHHGQRTDAGELMVTRIRRFQRDLRALVTEQGQNALAGELLPYALHFGMADRDQLPLVKFAHTWVDAFAGLPGWHQPPPSPPDFNEPDAVSKPSIDEQMMDPTVGMALWVTGGTI